MRKTLRSPLRRTSITGPFPKLWFWSLTCHTSSSRLQQRKRRRAGGFGGSGTAGDGQVRRVMRLKVRTVFSRNSAAGRLSARSARGERADAESISGRGFRASQILSSARRSSPTPTTEPVEIVAEGPTTSYRSSQIQLRRREGRRAPPRFEFPQPAVRDLRSWARQTCWEPTERSRAMIRQAGECHHQRDGQSVNEGLYKTCC